MRSAIFALHESAIASAFAPAQGRYALGTATRQVEALERIYPGSARVLTIRNGLDAARDTTLTELSSQFDALLEAGHLIPDPDALDVFDVLVKIKPIDGQHPLLNDPRLHARFVELARAAVAGARYAEALAVIAAAKLATPDDPTLGELRYEVETTIARLANERDAAAVLARLRAHEGAIDDLRDLTVIRDDLLELARVAPNEPLLANRKDQLERLVVAEITRTVTSEQWEQGETTLLQFAPLIDLEALTALRGQLWRAQRLAGFDPSPGAIEKRRALAEERAQRVNELLVRPELTPAWEAQFVPPFNEVGSARGSRFEEPRHRAPRRGIALLRSSARKPGGGTPERGRHLAPTQPRVSSNARQTGGGGSGGRRGAWRVATRTRAECACCTDHRTAHGTAGGCE